MNEPILISSKTIFSGKNFHVDESQYLLPNKKKVLYHDAIRKPVVAVLPVVEHQGFYIYLVSQYRTLLKRRALEVVAGHIDEGEKPLTAAKRELKEETGIDAFQWEQLRSIEGSASVFRTQVHFFLAKDIEIVVAEPEEDEEIKLVKLPLQEAVKKVMMGEINTATSMIGILLLDSMKKAKRL